ncbi:bifunctional 2-polyprenyl-6-hydroxyphenol methylase/3-demethylubiquinol 3-O-methyltransferase UbiG [Paenibacillus sp. VMFN-D1]|uniref:class I SAM-dependent methyltransferase n=1 Tax=Paenibacillus sp. VMFN-D1 TaxID=2135608 RepID=UPI000E22D625|nr:class I SAM-dependent methyltransferase [Paenibacillus sp. VMFN-D1]RED40820.1 methyltransferase family protein [Paenibacillus sp. VMFN-D1]
MKQNKYDDSAFFAAYKEMPRSIGGLGAAGEWHEFKALLPDLQGKSVLDLGCGFGWHCRYAREQHAAAVVGVDISANMLESAREQSDDPAITYLQAPIEDIDFPDDHFDVVLSSLAFHYVQSFDAVCQKVHSCLKQGGTFVFSVEHPIFTSRPEQEWILDDQGSPLYWPVDHYQDEGVRNTAFLTDHVIKYHRTLSTYINDLIRTGFAITAVREPLPDPKLMHHPGMKDETRRPMFLILSAEKK